MSSRITRDDRGSAIAIVPILILLVVAGLGALGGVLLSDNFDDDDTTNAAVVVPNPDLGVPCTQVAGPRPASAGDVREWLEDVADCVRNRIEGIGHDSDGEAVPPKGVSGLEDYAGTSVGGFEERVVVVRWETSTVPPIVLERIGELPNGVVVTHATTAG